MDETSEMQNKNNGRNAIQAKKKLLWDFEISIKPRNGPVWEQKDFSGVIFWEYS